MHACEFILIVLSFVPISHNVYQGLVKALQNGSLINVLVLTCAGKIRRTAGQVGSQGTHGREPSDRRFRTARKRHGADRSAGDPHELLLFPPRFQDRKVQVNERAQIGI